MIEDLDGLSRGSHFEGTFDTGQIQQHTRIMFIKYVSVNKRWTELKILFSLKWYDKMDYRRSTYGTKEFPEKQSTV